MSGSIGYGDGSEARWIQCGEDCLVSLMVMVYRRGGGGMRARVVAVLVVAAAKDDGLDVEATVWPIGRWTEAQGMDRSEHYQGPDGGEIGRAHV